MRRGTCYVNYQSDQNVFQNIKVKILHLANTMAEYKCGIVHRAKYKQILIGSKKCVLCHPFFLPVSFFLDQFHRILHSFLLTILFLISPYLTLLIYCVCSLQCIPSLTRGCLLKLYRQQKGTHQHLRNSEPQGTCKQQQHDAHR